MFLTIRMHNFLNMFQLLVGLEEIKVVFLEIMLSIFREASLGVQSCAKKFNGFYRFRNLATK